MGGCGGGVCGCVLCLCAKVCVCICHLRDRKKIFLVSTGKNKVSRRGQHSSAGQSSSSHHLQAENRTQSVPLTPSQAESLYSDECLCSQGPQTSNHILQF